MGGNLIKLVFKSLADGSGFAAVHADTQKLRSSMVDLGKASMILGGIFGDLGRVAGAGLKALLTGGMWEIAAQGIQLLIKLTGEHKALVDAAAKAMDAASARRMEALEKYHARLAQAANDAQAARIAEIKSIDAEAASLERAAKAAIELARQKQIAAGAGADVADAEAEEALKNLDRDSRQRTAASGVKTANAEAKSARESLTAANKVYEDLLRARERAARAVSERVQQIWAEENQFAARNGMRLKKELEAGFMQGREDESYKTRVDALDALDEKVAGARAAVAKAENRIAEAEKKRMIALRDEQSITKQIEAERLKEANDLEATELKAIEEREAAAKKAEDERIQREAEAEEALNEACRKATEESIRQEEEETRRLYEVRKELEREMLQAEQKANTDRANDLREKLKRAQADAAAAFEGWGRRGDIDNGGARRAERQKDVDRARLANAAIDLQARNPNWRTARNLSRQDEAARRWLLAKENEKKAGTELKDVVSKLDKIETLLQAATTL